MSGIAAQTQYPFASVIVLINNVLHRAESENMAQALVDEQEIDQYFFVEDLLPSALEAVGLTHQDLEPIPHYTDWALVMAYISQSEYCVHWDAEVKLISGGDWISPSIDLMGSCRGVFATNPSWTNDLDRVQKESSFLVGEFFVGYGFSDQIFLVRPSQLRTNIYRYWCLASVRYPLSAIGRIFEQRIDSFMRHRRLLRATYAPVVYEHFGKEGAIYPRYTFRQWAKHRVYRILSLLGKHWPTVSPCWKI